MGLENNRIVDPVLSQLALGYDPLGMGLVGQQLFPIVRVEKEAGKIPSFGKEAFRPVETERAIRAESNRVAPDKKGTISYLMNENDIYVPMDVREAQEDLFDLQKANSIHAQSIIRLNLEREHASLATTPGNYSATSKEALSGSTRWSQSTSTPIQDVKDGKNAVRKKIGRMPNTLILSANSMEALMEHASIIDRIKYSQTGIVNEDLLKSLFGIQNIFVAGAVGLGKTGTDFADIWGDNAVLAYVKNSTSPMEQNFGYTIAKKGYPQVDMFPGVGGKVQNVRYTDIWDTLLTNADAGFLISGTI